MPAKTDKQKVVLVTCADCRHFQRDTEGRSRSVETGEYFMGVCSQGLTPDSPIKQFASKPRICNLHNTKSMA